MKRHLVTLVATAVASFGALGVSLAQQPATPAAAAAPPSWVKFCEKGAFVALDKDGKEQKSEKNICLTNHERLDAASGQIVLSVAVREIEGEARKIFVVRVPLGMAIAPGVQMGIYPPAMWTAIMKGENVDDSKIQRANFGYSLCYIAGCTAELEVTPELLKALDEGGGLVVFAINGGGESVALPATLAGFTKTLAGAPVDGEAYRKGRQDMFAKLEASRKEMIEEYRKQNKELQSIAPGMQAAPAAPAAKASAPAAAPATGPAPAKKP